MQERPAAAQLVLKFESAHRSLSAIIVLSRTVSATLWAAGTTIEVATSSMSSCTTSPGARSCGSSVRVIRPILGGELWSSFRCEARNSLARPVYGDRSRHEDHFAHVRRENPENQKQMASAVDEDMKSLAASGPVISVSRSSGAEMNVTPSPSAIVSDACRGPRRLGAESMIGRIEKDSSSACARWAIRPSCRSRTGPWRTCNCTRGCRSQPFFMPFRCNRRTSFGARGRSRCRSGSRARCRALSSHLSFEAARRSLRSCRGG